MKRLCLISACFSVGIAVSIMVFMIILGFPLFGEGLFFRMLTGPWSPVNGQYGIFPMILGTLSIASLALCFGFPMSIGTAALISALSPRGASFFLKKIVQVMTGIPTVVYGFIGVFLLVPVIRNTFEDGSGMCILSASLLLGLLISPTMILLFIESFDQVPRESILAAKALGANRVQTFLYVILPSSVPGLISGVILAMGRAMGDTMIALMVSGNAIAFPDSLLSPARTLTAHIALIIASDVQSLEFKTLFACGIVLYLFTAVMVFMLRLVPRLFKEKP